MPKSLMKLGLLAASVAAGFSSPAFADDEAEHIKALEQQLQQNQKVIDQLSKRVSDLEQQGRPPAVATPAGVDPNNGNAGRATETPDPDVTTVSSDQVDHGVPIRGFFDVDWAHPHSKNLPGANGFSLGTLDLYLTPQFGDRVTSLFEVGFNDGMNTDGMTMPSVEVMRAQIGYVFSDALTLWAGRFHTPLGYWNTAYHHGAEIQTSITRPHFEDFEDMGGVLPEHTVGLWATGKFSAGPARVQYDLYAGNGDRINGGTLDSQASGDDNHSPELGFRLAVSPQALPELTVGLHGLAELVSGTDMTGMMTGTSRMRTAGGYVNYEGDKWEVIGEYYRFHDKDESGAGETRSSWAASGQVGYSLDDRWTVYGRAEKASLDMLDPYFGLQMNGTSYRQSVVGVRFNLDPRSALKLEFARNRDDMNADQPINWLRAQYSIAF